MSCVLRAGGTNFDVAVFLRDSSLSPHRVFRKGEAKSLSMPQKINPKSGFTVDASDAEFCDLARQIEDATLFLETHFDELQRLAAFPGVEVTELDFAIESRDVAVQKDRFTPQLLLLCGQLEVVLVVSRYEN